MNDDEFGASRKPLITPSLLGAILVAALVLEPLELIRIHSSAGGNFPTVAARNGLSGYSNYFGVVIYLAAVSALAPLLAKVLAHRAFLMKWIVVAAAGFLVWSIPYRADSPTFYSIDAPMHDTFHEGEILGLAPYVAAANAELRPILIHGPGMDEVSAWLGGKLAPAGYHIAGTRLVFRTLGSIATLLVFLSIFLVYREREVTLSLSPTVFMRSVFLGSAAFLIVEMGQITPRRLFLWLQMSLLVLAAANIRDWMRSGLSPKDGRRALILFAILGAAAPLSVFYNYGFGISGACLSVAGALLLVIRYRRAMLRPILVASLCSAVTVAMVVAIFGSSFLNAVIRDIRYWSATSAAVDCCFYPLWFNVSGSSTMLFVVFVTCALALAWIASLRNWVSFRKGFDDVYILSLMCGLAFFECRPFLQRADAQHLAHTIPSFVLIAVYLFAPLVGPGAGKIFDSIPAVHHPGLAWVMVATFGFLSLARMDPVQEVAHTAVSLAHPSRFQDASIVNPQDRSVADALEQEISKQPCFYALSNSAVWYYLFRRPSCSAFYEPLYAQSEQGQEEIVAELRRFHPQIVLAVDRGETALNELSSREICPAVFAYIQQAYEPYKSVSGRDFYKLRTQFDK